MIAQLSGLYIKTRPTKVISRLISYGIFEGRPVTTKGQWINPIIFSLFRQIKLLPQLKKVKKPIFIVGTGRSGTTILGLLMSMHKDVGFLNEPKALWHSIYPWEDLIGSYYRGPAQYRLKSEDASPEVISAVHKLYGAFLTSTCSSRVVDKYPELIFRLSFVKEIFPDAKFIFLVRNGWDTCFSIKRWSERQGISESNEIHDWWGVNNRKWKLLNQQIVVKEDAFKEIAHKVAAFSDHINMALVEWIVTMREGMRQLQKNGSSFLMVKYEDLTHAPRKTLLEISDFCDLPEDKIMFQYADQVIKPVKSHPHLEIDPIIYSLMNQTTKELGY